MSVDTGYKTDSEVLLLTRVINSVRAQGDIALSEIYNKHGQKMKNRNILSAFFAVALSLANAVPIAKKENSPQVKNLISKDDNLAEATELVDLPAQENQSEATGIESLIANLKTLAGESKRRVKRWGANWIATTIYNSKARRRPNNRPTRRPRGSTPRTNFDYDSLGGGIWG